VTTQTAKPAQPFWKRAREIRFLLVFVICYALFHTAYFMVPDSVLRDVVYYHGIVQVSEGVIDLAAPDERVSAVQNKLMSSKAALEVVRGCDGSGALFLIMAAIIAFSATVKRKLLGVFLGLVLIYLLNLTRIVGLYFVVAYQRDWFLPIHTYFAPTLIVIVSCIFFAWWALWSTGQDSNGQENEQPLVG
jgi:exosortase family protein XrtM